MALGVQHPDLGARPGLPDGPGPLQPLPRGDDGPAAFAGRVVLDHHRPPPVQHLALDVLRAGRGAVDHVPQRRDVVAAAGCLGQGEQPAELRGHHVRVGHVVPLGEDEQRLGLEAVHQHDRVAELDRDRREVQHRRVVERRAAQVHVVVEGASEKIPKNQVAVHGTWSGSSPVSGRRTPLGRPDVPEVYTMGAPAVRGSGRPPGPSAPSAANDANPGTAPTANRASGSISGALGRLRRDVGEPLVGHEGRGAAVVQDVGHLGGGQVPVHRHHVQPGLGGREEQRERLGAVGQHPGHGGAGAEPERLQAPAVPPGATRARTRHQRSRAAAESGVRPGGAMSEPEASVEAE